ncbi:norsolorinic acid reductase [Thozetella sp. PMI_491]|nr:norsolorinic acid reductase [Thozetella sp. PMI_491]
MSRTNVLPSAPPPKSLLGRYRLLAPTAGVRVSPLCLGAMNFGNSWKEYMGECDQSTTESILDYFFDQGGNFIDTSNNYQFGESEAWIGEWMKKRGNRDEMVIATKYTTNYKVGEGKNNVYANFGGNGSKSLHVSVEASLKRLQTDYIDLLYVHWWDCSTSIPELMQSLNHLITSGKVLYLGVSDTPAWVVSKANQYARDHGLRQFSVYQGRWSAASRDFERDIIPMARDEGMGLAPWGSIGGGAFKTEEQRKATGGRAVQASEQQIKVSAALEAVAKRKGTALTTVAIAYVMQKTAYVFPIIGGRNIDHLKGNIDALALELTAEDFAEIEGAVPFDIGFPMTFMYGEKIPDDHQAVALLRLNGTYDNALGPLPIKPAKGGQ